MSTYPFSAWPVTGILETYFFPLFLTSFVSLTSQNHLSLQPPLKVKTQQQPHTKRQGLRKVACGLPFGWRVQQHLPAPGLPSWICHFPITICLCCPVAWGPELKPPFQRHYATAHHLVSWPRIQRDLESQCRGANYVLWGFRDLLF